MAGGTGINYLLGDYGLIRLEAGRVVELYADNTLAGGDDRTTGGPEADYVIAGLGDDVIDTDAGDDAVLGDLGVMRWESADNRRMQTLEPEFGGDDVIDTGAGDDMAMGGGGRDVMEGGDGSDLLMGDFGFIDQIDGQRTADTTDPLFGDDDVLDGGPGNNILIGGKGADGFFGDFDKDIILGSFGRVSDNMDSGTGVLVSTDPANREAVARSMIDKYRTFTMSAGEVDATPSQTADAEREDVPLRLQRLLRAEDFAGLSDGQLRDFLRALPLPGDAMIGGGATAIPNAVPTDDAEPATPTDTEGAPAGEELPLPSLDQANDAAPPEVSAVMTGLSAAALAAAGLKRREIGDDAAAVARSQAAVSRYRKLAAKVRFAPL